MLHMQVHWSKLSFLAKRRGPFQQRLYLNAIFGSTYMNRPDLFFRGIWFFFLQNYFNHLPRETKIQISHKFQKVFVYILLNLFKLHILKHLPFPHILSMYSVKPRTSAFFLLHCSAIVRQCKRNSNLLLIFQSITTLNLDCRAVIGQNIWISVALSYDRTGCDEK